MTKYLKDFIEEKIGKNKKGSFCFSIEFKFRNDPEIFYEFYRTKKSLVLIVKSLHSEVKYKDAIIFDSKSFLVFCALYKIENDIEYKQFYTIKEAEELSDLIEDNNDFEKITSGAKPGSVIRL